MGGMAGTHRFSVVVPCYKVESCLRGCLDSLLSQTLDGLEIICVNDGSPDGSLEIMRSYQRRHSGSVKVVDQENGGLWSARRSGIEAASGEYIGFVDADDEVTSDWAERLYNAATQNGAELVVCGLSRVDRASGRVMTREFCQPRPPLSSSVDPGALVGINPSVCNKCFRLESVQRMAALEEPPSILEDLAFSLLFYLVMRGTIAFVPLSLYRYVVHQDSMINTVTIEQVETVKRMLLEVRSAYGRAGASTGLCQMLDASAFLHLGISMSFRLSCLHGVDLGASLRATTSYLDAHFPSWRRSPYTSLSYAMSHGPAFRRLAVASWFYKAHLMRPFLAAYRLALSTFGTDIKW